MNEEELFCKLFPEYVVNGKPLSPYFDLFESGYEQSEKRISELEKENAEAKERIKTLEYRCENIKDTDTMELVALQKENAQLKEANETLATMNDNMWVELEKKRAESQGITNKLHQLIKAKKIIEKLISLNRKEWIYSDVREEAEQFLKDSEVEK